jgi:type IV secretory pathway VirB2 component (pilin)
MKKISKIATGLAIVATLVPMVVVAATPYSIETPDTGLGTADLKTTVVNIINWVLGILALVAVVFVILGGFQWMTAGGNEEKIEKAKKVISAAVIGLIIVLLAWAIVIFVAGTTKNVTT